MLSPVLCLSLLFSIPSTSAAAERWDWAQSLAPEDTPNGSNARMREEDGGLVIDVEVVDSTPAAGPDPIHSDHVELWFATDRHLDVVQSAAGALLLAGNAASVEGVARALEPDPRDDDPCVEIENGLRAGVRAPPFRVKRSLVGLVHFGLFPDGRPAVQYDPEGYIGLGEPPLLLPKHSEDLTYQVERTATGYHLRARLVPRALLFIPREGVRSLRVRVDQIDAAPGAARERLLSTSRKPRWGDEATFANVALPRALGVSVFPELPELCGGLPIPPGLQPAWTRVPQMFVFTAKGWMSYERKVEELVSYELRVCAGVSIGVSSVTYHQAAPSAGRSEIRAQPVVHLQLEGKDGPSLAIAGEGQKRRAAVLGSGAELFACADGTLCALSEETHPTMGEYTSGICGAGTEHLWHLVRFDSPVRSVPLFTWEDCNDVVTPAPGIKADFASLMRDDEHPHHEPHERLYTWEVPGQKVTFVLGEALPPFSVSWDPMAKTLRLDAKPPSR